MTERQKAHASDRPVIPHVNCPRCRSGMRLAVIEPGAMRPSGRDTLVFECTCGFAFRQPVTDS